MRRSPFSSPTTFVLLALALTVAWLGWRGNLTDAPAARSHADTAAPAEAPAAAVAEVTRTPAPDDGPPIVIPDALAAAVEDMLFGTDDGVLGYLRCVDLVANGEATRELASLATLDRLLADAKEGAPRLRQVGLPAALLLADEAPTHRVAARGRRYRTDTSTHPVHTNLRTRLGNWPDPIDRAAVDALVASLLELPERELEARLAELLRSDDPNARRAVRAALRTFANRGDGNRLEVVAWVLLHTEDGVATGVAELLGCATELQCELASERTGPAVNHLAISVRSMLAGGQYARHTADPRLRAALVDTLAAAAHGTANQHGSAVFAAIALGGVGEDARAANALAGLVKANPNATIGNTAVVNLGYATDPAGFLAMLPRFPDAPADAAAVLPHLDYLVGLLLSTRRHPEQAEAVVPFLTASLTSWHTTSLQRVARRHLLDVIADDPRPEFAPALQRLAADTNDEHAAVAQQIVERLR